MEKKDYKSEIIDFFKDLVVIVAIVLIIRTFIVEPFQISGESMAKSYYDKEFIIVDRFSYLDIPWIKIWEPKRWDVIVFRPEVSKDKEYFIKRIIGLPGDTIKIENWWVYLKKSWSNNFVKLDEKYLSKENYWHTKVWQSTAKHIFKVPAWKYFVMWDNRNHSSDSRVCFSFSCEATSRDNFVTKDEIVWKVLIDLGYFNFRNFSFKHPWSLNFPETKWIDTFPRFFNSPSSYNYE